MLKVPKRLIWQPIVIAFFLTLITIISQPMGKIDRVWSDVVLTSEKIPVSQKQLIVDISSQDMGRFNGPPLPREVLVNTLTHLQELGAKRVLLDLTLSQELSSEADSSLIKAMKSFGPNNIAIPQGGAEKFNASATIVDLSLLTDPDGWTRSVRTSKSNSGFNPAIWLATGQLSKDKARVDLRYDSSTIQRVTLSRLLDSRNVNLTDYSVIISPDASVVSSRVQLPLGNGPDRSLMIAHGSESVSAGYQNVVRKTWMVNVLIALIFMISGVILATFIHRARLLFLACLLMCFTAVGINMAMMKFWGGQAYPVMQFSSLLIGAIVTIAYRLRLYHMVAGFLKGDLSPEEAWAWRAQEDSQFPVILINAMGNIRRMNSAAEKMKVWLGDDFAQANFRREAMDVTLTGQDGVIRKFAFEWPNRDVAIIVLKDVTEAERRFDEAVELAESYEEKKNLAEAASQHKSKFLANMSHELRTPLNAINGFSDILNREIYGPLGDPRYKEFASNILFSGQHLLSLINDILDLSKIEAGKMKLNYESVQVDNLISQAILMVNGRAKEGQLRLIYETTNLTPISADPRAVKQVILNLLTNAIKFTPEGGVVKVATETHPSSLVIYVSDSGMGISQEDLKRLTKPFEQVNNKDTKKIEGTGLGLSLSKSLVELHGGTFKIESMVGKGTRVTFVLPHQQPQQETIAGPATQNVANLVPHPKLKSVG